MGLHHCGIETTSSQITVIVGFVLRLGPSDGEGGFVSRDGAREAIRLKFREDDFHKYRGLFFNKRKAITALSCKELCISWLI